MGVGIERLALYGGRAALPLGALAAARDLDPVRLRDDLMVDERTVVPPWEDTVTLAVNAADRVVDAEDRHVIDLVLVGTETAVDLEKPVASWVHGHLGLQPRARTLEIKHACYSGTGALVLAAAMVRAGLSRRALVVAADMSLPGLGKPWEPILGAGAAAAIVSASPRLLELELEGSGLWANEVTDVIRPTGQVETGSSEESLYSYLESVHEAWEAYAAATGRHLDRDFAASLYHVPFGGMTWRAHRTLARAALGLSNAEARAHWAARTEPSIAVNRRVGGTYGGSLMFALAGLLQGRPELRTGERVGLFSYGSGCCAEYYSGLVGPDARAALRSPDLDSRATVDVNTYERTERERDAGVGARDFHPDPAGWGSLYEEGWAGRGLLVLEGIDDYVRTYGRS